MGPLDAVWHLLNFFAPALVVGALAAVATKLLWRKSLAGVALTRLLLWSCGAGMLVTIAGLVLLGRDGRVATYAAMVFGCAVGLWWGGFVRGR